MPKDNATRFGPKVTQLSYDFLIQWDCVENVKAMVFDTISANTGHLSAACISIQEKLGRQLPWCPCRHHIGEIIISRVWKALNIELSKSPEVSIFSRFKSSFHLLSTNQDQQFFCKFTEHDERIPGVIEFCQQMLQDFCRDDYKELLKLVLLYLTGQSLTTFNVLPPGAIHNARWMAKIITFLKLLLLEDKIKSELPKGQIFRNAQQRNKIFQFVSFVTFTYLPYWYTANSSLDFPSNDLKFWNNIKNHNNSITKNAALKVFKNHTWYLTEELILLSLFSPNTTKLEKQEIVKNLQDQNRSKVFQNRHGNGHGKPVLSKISAKAKLSDFVGPSSWHFFEHLDIDTSFLSESQSDWEFNEAYNEARTKVKRLAVVNDPAERGVKLTQDFLHTAKNENTYQNVLQVVEHHRKQNPNQRKKNKK